MGIPDDVGQAKVITATTVISTKYTTLLGIFVTTSLATSRLWISNAAASTASTASAVVVRKFVSSVAKAPTRIPIDCPSGLTINMAGSAQVVTVIYKPNAYAPA